MYNLFLSFLTGNMLLLSVLWTFGALALASVCVWRTASKERFCRSTDKARARQLDDIVFGGVGLFLLLQAPAWVTIANAVIALLKSIGFGYFLTGMTVVFGWLSFAMFLRRPFKRLALRRRREIRLMLGLEVANTSRPKSRSYFTTESAESRSSVHLSRKDDVA